MPRKGREREKDATNSAVDQYHSSRSEEILKLYGSDVSHNEEEGIVANKQVMDLGAGGDSSDESSAEDDSSLDGVDGKDEQSHQKLIDDQDTSDASSDEGSEYEDDAEKTAASKWGKKKSLYYHGDTADLEIGQDKEDAFDEEEAAREVQKSRLVDMNDADFLLISTDLEESGSLLKSSTKEVIAARRDSARLSLKEKRTLLKASYPEVLPLASYFAQVVKDLKTTTRVATKVLTGNVEAAQSVGASDEGQKYLLVKSMIQYSMALNAAMLLLVKSDDDEAGSKKGIASNHPVVARLEKVNGTMEKFENRFGTRSTSLAAQLEHLVKAAMLMDSSCDIASEEDTSSFIEESATGKPLTKTVLAEDSDEASSDEFSSHEENMDRKLISDEARFGLRQNEINRHGEFRSQSRSYTSAVEDFGDLDGINAKSFASTINAIEQRSTALRGKRKLPAAPDQLDDPELDIEPSTRGLKFVPGNSENAADKKYACTNEFEESDDFLEFYDSVAKKSRTQKAQKKSLYDVSPKYPVVDNELDAERAISRAIMKNRGLVAHKAKINRNPRVKKREQYRKALIRRKGAVREIRTDEGHKYGGEETGIKSGISRSRKLVS